MPLKMFSGTFDAHGMGSERLKPIKMETIHRAF